MDLANVYNDGSISDEEAIRLLDSLVWSDTVHNPVENDTNLENNTFDDENMGSLTQNDSSMDIKLKNQNNKNDLKSFDVTVSLLGKAL